MALLVVNGGEVLALNYYVNKATPENLIYELFATNITPAETDVIGTYTLATGGGYANKTLTGASWTTTSAAVAGAAETVYAEQDYTFTGPLTTNGTLYGYLAKRATGGELMHAETFTSFTPTNNGDKVLLTPKITAA